MRSRKRPVIRAGAGPYEPPDGRAHEATRTPDAAAEMRHVGEVLARQLEESMMTAHGQDVLFRATEYESLGRMAVAALLTAGWTCVASSGEQAVLLAKGSA